jgi:eukaryotic-like serine/threonine-protein kinase
MPDVNELIGGYKLKTLLQTGAASQVFEVVEPKSGMHYAMKILLPEHADNPEHRRMLFHEFEVGQKMRHVNVINIQKLSQSESTPHFIMEFFPSGSLRKKLQGNTQEGREFIKKYAKKIFKQMATGLAYMNSSSYVHRDVKPDNVLVNALGETKIIDFAITKKIETGFFAKLLRKRSSTQGTHSFMSPEQIRNEIIDGRADIYSYGVTLFELCCGRLPFRGASRDDLLRKHLVEKPPPVTTYNPDVTDEFSNFLIKLMAKKREDRPATFHDVMMQAKKIRIFKSVPDFNEEEQG